VVPSFERRIAPFVVDRFDVRGVALTQGAQVATDVLPSGCDIGGVLGGTCPVATGDVTDGKAGLQSGFNGLARGCAHTRPRVKERRSDNGGTCERGRAGSELHRFVPGSPAFVVLGDASVAAGLGVRTAVQLFIANKDVVAGERHGSDVEGAGVEGEASGVQGVTPAASCTAAGWGHGDFCFKFS
jgi:hypothetical protein